MAISGIAIATGPDFPNGALVYAFDGRGSAETAAHIRLCRGGSTIPEYDGGSAQPQWLPAASSAQSQAPKKIPEPDAIFANIKEKDGKSMANGTVKRVSIDCKATVNIGPYSRGGVTRGDNQAADHDMGCEEKHTPFGIVDEDTGQLDVMFGSSAKTSDFIVDSLEEWWERLSQSERENTSLIQIKADNGPESNSRRTQFLHRIVAFADVTGKPIQLLYYPPYHSKYNPIERCWGILEKHWNGTQLVDVDTMLEWAKSMKWKGIHPIVELSRGL